MAERRSLGAAMEMTPEKLEFIKGRTKTETPLPSVASAATSKEKTIDLEDRRPPAEASKDSAPRISRRSNRRSSSDAPGASEVLDQVLVPVTIRLPHRIAQALKRAYLEQRLKHAKPDTQQEIVDEALGEWLARHGFIN